MSASVGGADCAAAPSENPSVEAPSECYAKSYITEQAPPARDEVSFRLLFDDVILRHWDPTDFVSAKEGERPISRLRPTIQRTRRMQNKSWLSMMCVAHLTDP